MKASLALLEDFFHGCDQDGWGYSNSEIAAAEARLSVTFPKVLKEYYSKFGTCPYIKDEGNNIPVPFALEDFFIPDSTYNAPHHTPKELDFLVTIAFWQIAYESRLEHSLDVDQFSYDSEELPDLNSYITGLGMNGCELENLSEIAHYFRIFLKAGVILSCETDEWDATAEPPSEDFVWLAAASNDREKIQAIKKIPDLLWEEDNDIEGS